MILLLNDGVPTLELLADSPKVVRYTYEGKNSQALYRPFDGLNIEESYSFMAVYEPLENASTLPKTSPIFSPSQLHTLALICDTLIPTLHVPEDAQGFYRRCASDLDVPHLLAGAIEQVADQGMVSDLGRFLSAIENPLLNAGLMGKAYSFSQMTLDERSRLLFSWETSRFNLRRKAFQALKRLALMLFYSVVDEHQHNPNWVTLNYAIPPSSPMDVPLTKIVPTVIEQDSLLHSDVVIIGSGAGGGVVAGELSAAGLDVIVLEKGDYYSEADFDGVELRSMERMFENRGMLTSSDLNILLLAGSTLGGGTTVNWAASFRTPDDVREEWAKYFGLREFVSDSYTAALDAVEERIQVGTASSVANVQNGLLESGAKKLGLSHGIIPRNVSEGEDCGFCNFGCKNGTKQGTLRTYLQDAFERGSRIIVRAQVEKVLVEYGQAVGVLATVTTRDGQVHRIEIRAKTVVVAGGALNTPLILMKSGLGNEHIGRNLHLHPTTVTFGIYDEAVEGWYGPIMSRYVDSVKNLDGQGYGATLETAPIHPGIAALSLSWRDGLQHKQTMAQLKNLANIIVLTRDMDGGEVKFNRYGRMCVRYTPSAYDSRHIMRGIVESIRIHAAAGAKQIGAPFAVPYQWRRDEDNLEDFLGLVQNTPLLPNNFALFSAHQMSSCRMADSPIKGAVKPTGETFEVKGLYVADGSVLPTASGVNPMLSIMATAYMIAGHIKAAWQRG